MLPLLLPLVAPFAAPIALSPTSATQDAPAASPAVATPGSTTPAARFAAPVRLRAGEAWMGATLLYPSPRMLDVDRDGTAELVLGDLWGKVRVSEPAGGDDPLAFGETAPLRTGDRAIEFHNW